MTQPPTNRAKPVSPRIGDRRANALLIYPFSGNKNNSPPLGVAMIGAILKKHDCDVKVIDAAAMYAPDFNTTIEEVLRSFKPDLIGLSLILGNEGHAYQIIAERLSSLGAPIIAGGPHATVMPDEALGHGVDIVVSGEGEETILDIVLWLRGGKNLEDIQGISFSGDDGKIVHNPSRAMIRDLDALPLPAHELFRPEYYFESEIDYERGGRLLSSRGCPNKCAFCANPIFGRKFRYRSPDSVVEEIEYLSNLYKINKFEFLDDAFTANRARVFDLCNRLREMPDVTFTCVTRLENLDEETVPLLRAAGLFRAHIGVESMRPETLRRIHKNIDLSRLEPVLRLLRKNGIESYLFFMHGFPWETADDLRENLEGLKRIKPLVTYFAEGGVVAPYPGTEIYEEFAEATGFRDWWLKSWQPTVEPLHDIQPWYFFPYNDEQKEVIRETLDFILQHNRGSTSSNPQVRLLARQVAGLREHALEVEAQLKELWGRSIFEKAKRLLKKIGGA